jgi:hypothetical protein
MTAEEAVSMMAPRGLWHPKHDSSVSGPEFASQPATLAYWRGATGHLAGMFRALLHGGMRSHEGDTCGMHVNIGASAFADAGHLYRFATLVHVNPRWAIKMAQRTAESSGHWARFDVLADADDRREWAERYMTRGACYQTERYAVLNGQNPGRIEFRLPRGTLRIDRFFAKLEWTAAMVEYTRDESRPVQVSSFIAWAHASGEYPTLVAYIRERFPSRLADDVLARENGRMAQNA